MRIRQAVLVAADLERVLADLEAVLAVQVAYRDPGVAAFGLHNGVMPVGDQFLEVVSPTAAGTSAGRYLERRRGDGGYMVILQAPDLDAARRRFAAGDARIVWEIAFDDIATVHLHPRDTGGAIVSVDEARPAESWRWGGPQWRDHVRTTRVSGIAGLELQSEDPAGLCARWQALFGLGHLELPPDAAPVLVDDRGATITFVSDTDGRGEGLAAIVLAATDPDAALAEARARGLAVDAAGNVTIGGVRFRFVPAAGDRADARGDAATRTSASSCASPSHAARSLPE